MIVQCISHYSKTFAYTITGLALCFWGGCSSDSDVDDMNPYAAIESVELEDVEASGFVEKGPFVTGSSLKLFEVHGAKLSQTGKSYTGKLKSNDGSFSITASKLQSQYAIIEATGYYKNEISGFNSNGPLTLTAFVDLKDRRNVNVNLLTHLEYERILSLHETGINFPSAKHQAASEIFATFGFVGEFGEPEDCSIFGESEGDAALLAVSVLMQGNRTEADMSELIARIANEIGETGAWEDMKQKTAIADWAFGADLKSIRNNVESWNMGNVPKFEKYVEMFWRYVYGLEECSSKNEDVLQVIENEYSKNNGQVVVCKNGVWQEATFDDINDTNSIIPTPSTQVNEEIVYGSITDSRDGNVYKFVTIGDQVWMAENLNYKISASHCARNDCDAYGRLYPWAVTQSEICPDGWRVPTNSEWETLYAYIDGNNGNESIETSLKAQTTWVTPGSDRFGFNALSAGYYWGEYQDVGIDAAWWSSSEDNFDQGYDWRLYHGANYDDLGMPKDVEFAIRCIKKNGAFSEKNDAHIESSSSAEAKSSSSFKNEASVHSSSSKNANSITIAEGPYDCGEYNCVTTEYLNQEMLAAGKYGEFLDTRDNQVYRTVTIGTQTWMAQNLNYNAEGSQCYDGLDANCAKYGRLYYWSGVSDSQEPDQGVLQGSCPDGWHIPSDEEFLVLAQYVGKDRTADIKLELSGWPTYYSYEESGLALKSKNYKWSVAGSDEYGFSAIASGDRWDFGSYDNLGVRAVYWTSKISDVEWGPRAITRRIEDAKDFVSAHWDLLDYMFAIRCIKNE